MILLASEAEKAVWLPRGITTLDLVKAPTDRGVAIMQDERTDNVRKRKKEMKARVKKMGR